MLPSAEVWAFRDVDTAILATLRERQIESLSYLAGNFDSPVQRVYDKVFECQRRVLEEVVGALAQRTSQTIVFKGAESLAKHYRNRALCMLGDVDILVRAEEVKVVKDVLQGLGLRQADYDIDRDVLVEYDADTIANAEQDHYELAPFRILKELQLDPDERESAKQMQKAPMWMKGERCVVAVQCDVHHAVATDVDSVQFFDRAVASAVGQASTMSAADHVWFMVSRMYTEAAIYGSESLRGFAYLAPEVACGDVDWDCLLRSAHEYDLRPGLYYYLSFLDRLSDSGVIPPEALDALNPTRGSRARDWGWQLGRLFSTVERFPFDEPILRAARE